MIGSKPWLGWLTHILLIIGVVIVAFPIYVTFVASTHSLREVVQSPMPILPGDELVENYARWASGRAPARWGPGACCSTA